jgi:ribonuclease HII
VDEAGRGPLAGPVVAAAVILHPDIPLERLENLGDSKTLTHAQREKLFDLIGESSLAVGVGIVDHAEIDRINILQAAMLAMRNAVGRLNQAVDLVLVDGNFSPGLSFPEQLLVKGDALSASIAAASIIAKVTRDRLMVDYHREYPEYRFDRHKGYCSRFHLSALEIFGPCPIHRRSFEPVRWSYESGTVSSLKEKILQCFRSGGKNLKKSVEILQQNSLTECEHYYLEQCLRYEAEQCR